MHARSIPSLAWHGMAWHALRCGDTAGPGVTTKPIKTSYSASAGTAYVIFENVLVPKENIIGEENNGFMAIMANFNHERYRNGTEPDGRHRTEPSRAEPSQTRRVWVRVRVRVRAWV